MMEKEYKEIIKMDIKSVQNGLFSGRVGVDFEDKSTFYCNLCGWKGNGKIGMNLNFTYDEFRDYDLEFRYRIVNEKNEKLTDDQVFYPNSPLHESGDSPTFSMNWDEFTNEENGFVKDGITHIEVIIATLPVDKLIRKQLFSERQENFKGFELDVQGEILSISSMLAEKSAYFKKEIKLSWTNLNHRLTLKLEEPRYEAIFLLELLHNCGRAITDQTVGILLKLCVKYDCPVEIQQCEKYIIESTTMPMIQKLIYADTYKLERLKRYCIYQVKSTGQLEDLINMEGYDCLSESIRLEILQSVHKNLSEPEVYMIEGVIRDFKAFRGWLTDTILVVNGVEFYVSKQILSWESEIFESIFNEAERKEAEKKAITTSMLRTVKEGAKFSLAVEVMKFITEYTNSKEATGNETTRIKIENTNVGDFNEFLQMIYQPTNPVTCSNFKSMLDLSHRFKVKFIIGKCQRYLIEYPYMELIDKLMYAGKYELEKLTDQCMIRINTYDDLRKLKETGRMDEVSGDIAKKILLRIR